MKCLLILTLLASMICFGCSENINRPITDFIDEDTAEQTDEIILDIADNIGKDPVEEPVVEEPVVEEPVVEEPVFVRSDDFWIFKSGLVSLKLGILNMNVSDGRCTSFQGTKLRIGRIDVHQFDWLYRSDENSDFTPIEGAGSKNGICGLKREQIVEPGEYIARFDFSIDGKRYYYKSNVVTIE